MKRSTLLLWIGFGVSLLLLAALLRKIDGRQLLHALADLDWRCLLAAVGLTFVSYWFRAVRWRLLLLHERPIALGSLYSAIVIGYMANNLFPARLGEIVRVWLLARREQLKVAPVFATLVIDRMVDGCAMMIMLAVVLLTLQLPPGMERVSALLRAGGITTLVLYLSAVCFVLFLKFRRMQALKLLALLTQPFSQRFRDWLIPLAGSFLDGLRLAPGRSNLLLISICSALIWISATLPIHLVLRGFGIQLPLIASFFIMVLLVFAVMIPSAPGYIGTYHVACYTALSAFRLSDSQAVSIALVIHGVGFFPVIMAGFYHLWSDGLSLRTLRTQAVEQGAEL